MSTFPLSASHRARSVRRPVIPEVAALIRAHPGTISLGQGVVHYPPPQCVLPALGNFGAQLSEHHYQDVFGDPALVAAIAEKVRSDNGIHLDAQRFIMVTGGSNMAFFHCILAICDPGDEIIMMSPFYFNHEMAAVMAQVKPVLVATDADYQPCPERITAAITARTRAIVTISPNNPAGVVYPPATLGAINDICRERHLYHISDEAYEYFVYDGARHFSPASMPDTATHTISLFSLSKSYGMASWRVGYAVVPSQLRTALAKIQDTVLICPPAPCQRAATAALEVGAAYCRQHLADMDQIRRMCQARLASLAPRCRVPRSAGAFYLLATLDSSQSAMEVVTRLISDFGVAVIPGSAFGISHACCLRIAYGALEQASVTAGMDRLVTGLEAILAREP